VISNGSRRWPLRDLHSPGGFTLLEVLISLALLGIALTVILQIFSANLRNIGSAEDYGYAAAKASARMREIVDNKAMSETAWTERTPDGYKIDVSVVESLKDRTANLPVRLLQVDLTIHWLKGTRDKSLTFRTIKTVVRS
jgi:prepilin-type N-terminal cleavage/methylation domain-containing protein